ncbi:hypothetical protein GCM10015535_37870 [Streptomyces gelaticus]|uniref:Uncharacterized protein n=1 Tax=Streptomyces gelaticus TaxID=285446 RepID=A0ABQ2W0E3_9ACTN|nr:hypothetical protein GCM10015535_37870 [Streptomyces gelaticus]
MLRLPACAAMGLSWTRSGRMARAPELGRHLSGRSASGEVTTSAVSTVRNSGPMLRTAERFAAQADSARAPGDTWPPFDHAETVARQCDETNPARPPSMVLRPCASVLGRFWEREGFGLLVAAVLSTIRPSGDHITPSRGCETAGVWSG